MGGAVNGAVSQAVVKPCPALRLRGRLGRLGPWDPRRDHRMELRPEKKLADTALSFQSWHRHAFAEKKLGVKWPESIICEEFSAM